MCPSLPPLISNIAGAAATWQEKIRGSCSKARPSLHAGAVYAHTWVFPRARGVHQKSCMTEKVRRFKKTAPLKHMTRKEVSLYAPRRPDVLHSTSENKHPRAISSDGTIYVPPDPLYFVHVSFPLTAPEDDSPASFEMSSGGADFYPWAKLMPELWLMKNSFLCLQKKKKKFGFQIFHTNTYTVYIYMYSFRAAVVNR